MLSASTIHQIRDIAQSYWHSEAQKDYFVDIAKGKEVGHRIADLIDEKTCAILTVNFLTRHECDPKGKRKIRSMGDVWLAENDVYHPINVKAGLVGSEGQPNLVSLKKILDAIVARWIDSYYLLMVKVEISDRIQPTVYLLDMLDHLDYVTFDSGPGQMMLKARSFFNSYSATTEVVARPLNEKLVALLALLEDGEVRLRKNREHDIILYRERVAKFLSGALEPITPETQRGLNLQ